MSTASAITDTDADLTWTEDIAPIFGANCGAGCHLVGGTSGGLNLESGGYDNVVNEPSTELPSMDRVEPGSTDESYLWHKLDHTAKVGSGMPRTLLGAKRLPPAELERFRRWIEDGAQP
jgi:hypothetical protein